MTDARQKPTLDVGPNAALTDAEYLGGLGVGDMVVRH